MKETSKIDEHCRILDAIRDRDGARARQLMYGHIFGSRDKVMRLAVGGFQT
jgi:DNA-binding GntR family transcriptional regulator